MTELKTLGVDLEEYVFVSAVIVATRDYFFVAHHVPSLDKGKHVAHLLRCQDGAWHELAAWPWQAVGLLVSSVFPLRVEVLGRDGEVGVLAGEVVSQEHLEPGTAIGPMRGIDSVFGRAIVYGMQRQIFVRDFAMRWIRFDNGMAATGAQGSDDIDSLIRSRIKSDGGINVVVPYQADRLMAFGMRGEMWRYRGNGWQQMDSPSNLMLKDATIAPDGEIYVCGLRGTLLKGHDDRWLQVPYRGPSGLGFCSIRWFAGQLFVADGHSLRTLVDGELKVIDFGTSEGVPCKQVVVGPGEVMSLAGQEVWLSNDGEKWTALVG